MVALTDPRQVLRVTPDKTAPNAPPSILYKIFSFDADLAAWILFPLYIPYLTICYFLFNKPKPYPGYTFTTLLSTRYQKLRIQIIYKILPAPLSAEEEWKIPKDAKAYWEAMKAGEARVGVSSVPPLEEEMRRGIGECPFVDSVKRPGFMITPKGAVGGGVEKAKEGERIIYHLHGG